MTQYSPETQARGLARVKALLTSPRFWKKLPVWLPLILLLVGLAYWLLRDKEEAATYNTAQVTRGNIENLVTATGILQPRDYVDVGAQVSGQLKILHVDVGAEVKKGDLLAEIDATVYAANVDGTRAQLVSQKAQLRDREAQLKLAEINYRRQKNLQELDAGTKEALDTAEASLTSIRAQIDVLKAQIQQTESNLRAQEANLDYANIYAPMDGTVVSLSARQGQTLNANQMAPTIMRIADLSTMTVQTQVSEADVGKLRVGMPVYFTTLGSGPRRWYSRLDRIQPTPEILNNVVLYNALFDVPNEQRTLMTQMSTQVFFISAQAKDALLVPMSALSFVAPERMGPGPGRAEASAKPEKPEGAARPERPQGSEGPWGRPGGGPRDSAPAEPGAPRDAVVQVMDAHGRLQERKVKVGVTNRIQAEVIEGLQEGETVVTGTRQANQAPQQMQGGPRGFGPRMMR
jgi:macrolide-specific efflux system membrane fusion protein